MIDHKNLEEFSDAVNYDMQDTSDAGIAFYSASAQRGGWLLTSYRRSRRIGSPEILMTLCG